MPFDPLTVFDVLVLESDSGLAGADNDPVALWEDQAAGNDATQAVGDSQPIKQTNELNSLPIARFTSGSPNRYFALGDVAAMDFGTGAFSIFIVVNANVTTQLILVKDDVNGADNGIYIAILSNMFTYYNGSVGIDMGAKEAAFHFIGATRAGTGAGGVIPYYDGTAGTPGQDARTLSNTKIVTIGADADGTFGLTGDIAAVYIGTGVLSEANRNAFGGYIETKYGLTIAGATFDNPTPVTGAATFAGAAGRMNFGIIVPKEP